MRVRPSRRAHHRRPGDPVATRFPERYWSFIRYGTGPRAAAPNASRLIGPADRRVMTILAGIVPAHPVIAERVAGRTHAERQLVRADWMAGVCAHLSAWMRGRQRIY